MKDLVKKTVFFVLTAVISAGVSWGVYSFREKREAPLNSYTVFDGQTPYHFASLTEASGVNTDFTVAAEKAVHAVVHIKSTETRQVPSSRGFSGDPFFDFLFGERGFGPPQPREREGIGSGVIISADGYIMTNNHVIENADKIEVTLNDKRSFQAKLVGVDDVTDIALLKIEANDLSFIPFGDSDKLKIGEWVLAIGNPFNLTSTVTAGIVSAKARSLGMGKMGIESFIQTDAAVNLGNSGGALINTSGELVGINTAIASQTGNFAGYSFAVPINMASKVVTDIKQYGSVQRAVMGIELQDIDASFAKEKDLSNLEGVYVKNVVERSAAMEAGIEKGDVITEVNGVKVKSVSELQAQVNRYRPGDKVSIKAYRGKDLKTFSLTLKNRQGNTDVVKDKGVEILGAAFKPVTPETKRQMGISYGVEVTGLTKGKFQTAGMRKGFIILKINDQPVASQEDIENITSKLFSSDEQAMFIVGMYPNGRLTYYAIDLSD